MKTIGLVGGTYWQSTIQYYLNINRAVQTALGTDHSAKVIIDSIDPAGMIGAPWTDIEKIIGASVARLAATGVDAVALTCDTLHMVADPLSKTLSVPFLHIIDPIVEEIARLGIKNRRIGLLGSKTVMSESFYADLLRERGIDCVLPGQAEQDLICEIMHEGQRDLFVQLNDIVEYMVSDNNLGAVILGCSELPIILAETSFSTEKNIVHLLDSAALHSTYIARFMLTELEPIKWQFMRKKGRPIRGSGGAALGQMPGELGALIYPDCQNTSNKRHVLNREPRSGRPIQGIFCRACKRPLAKDQTAQAVLL